MLRFPRQDEGQAANHGPGSRHHCLVGCCAGLPPCFFTLYSIVHYIGEGVAIEIFSLLNKLGHSTSRIPPAVAVENYAFELSSRI